MYKFVAQAQYESDTVVLKPSFSLVTGTLGLFSESEQVNIPLFMLFGFLSLSLTLIIDKFVLSICF